MKKYCYAMTTVTVICGLFVGGCATTGESAGLGAGLGAMAGAIIGQQSGHAVEGAIVGALVGGVAGVIIGNERQKKLASRQQVEQEYFQTTNQKVDAPMVSWDEFSVTPQSVQPGQKITAQGRYVLMGPPPATPPSGAIHFKKGSEVLSTAPMKEVNEGRVEFSRDITISPDLEDGEYELAVEVTNGNSIAKESQPFIVARAQ